MAHFIEQAHHATFLQRDRRVLEMIYCESTGLVYFRDEIPDVPTDTDTILQKVLEVGVNTVEKNRGDTHRSRGRC